MLPAHSLRCRPQGFNHVPAQLLFQRHLETLESIEHSYYFLDPSKETHRPLPLAPLIASQAAYKPKVRPLRVTRTLVGVPRLSYSIVVLGRSTADLLSDLGAL